MIKLKLGILRGTFKMITANHVELIREASKLVDELWIAIDSDELIAESGKAGVLNERERKVVLRSIKGVSGVFVFSSDDDFFKTASNLTVRNLYSDHVYFKGGDYAPKDLPEAGRLQTMGFTVCCLSNHGDRHTSEILDDYLGKRGLRQAPIKGVK